MNSRLSRPLLAAVVSGAFLVGGGTFAAPALAAPPASTEPSSSPTVAPPTSVPPPPPPTDEPTTEPPTDPASTSPTDPTTTSPTPSDPTTTAPETTPPASPPASSTPPTSTTPPPPADKTAPTGAFSLNRTSIYPGQSVTLTLTNIKDNVSTPAQIKRVVTWGDGTSSSVSTSAKTVSHTYKGSGKRPLTLTLTDAAGNKRVLKSSALTVVPSSVKYKLSKTSVMPGQRFVWELTGIPAGATKIAVSWGDGRTTVISKPKKQKITRYYYATPSNAPVPAGVKTLKATAFNKYGGATPQVVGKVTLKKDGSRPVVKIIQPSKPSKASSWKAIKGTATDKGSGIKETYAFAILGKSNGTVLCYSGGKKKWITAPEDDAAPCLIPVKVSKGKFSVPLKNTPKGYLIVQVIAADWAGLTNPTAKVERMLS